MELRNAGGLPTTPAGHGFLRLLGGGADSGSEGDPDALLEFLFAETMVSLDAVWLERRASYMQFPEVLKEVRRRVERVLGRRWLTAPSQLRGMREGLRVASDSEYVRI